MSIDGPVRSIMLTGAADAPNRRQRQHNERPVAWQRRGGLEFAGNPDPERGKALLREEGAASLPARIGGGSGDVSTGTAA